MKYVLMHKEIPVAAIELDEVLCGIRKIEKLYNPEHLPVGIHTVNGNVNREELNSWWRNGSIPSSRVGLRSALDELNIHFFSTSKLIPIVPCTCMPLSF